MEIRSKARFFELWEAGLLGNRPNLWRDPQKAWAAQPKTVGFRELGRAGGGAWTRVYDMQKDFWLTVKCWEGRNYVMDDGCPDHKQTLQGEVCRTFRGLEGFMGSSTFPMRKAAELGILRHRSPAETTVLLRDYMDASSRDDLEMLLELYPDAAVEFTCFSVNVGVIPGRNTLIWEIRNY